MMIWRLILAGVVVHLILFYSIFDIYFTSPLVHGMTPVKPRIEAPAKRVVLFVADGLRADKFFEPKDDGTFRAPHLRQAIETRGAWGISHTRVPTESRPGHVALIAGFYEDVSAVAKGWKENPVEFDSVFNQSRKTWAWGSPDILPMFAKGTAEDHVITHSYPAHFEDFAGKNLVDLDVWVFNSFKKFLDHIKIDPTLEWQLSHDKTVLFLHLLGIDTNGHANKPDSEEYSENIRYVDNLVKEVERLLDILHQYDNRTAYFFTSDHGMTNWGSHGAGHPHETLTPLVAWGAGIRRPIETYDGCGDYNDNFCSEWQLTDRARVDVEQADVAALMAFVIGIPFPVNSVGVLPLGFLDGAEDVKGDAICANAAQILAQYKVKMELVKERTLSVFFRPFPELTADIDTLVKNFTELLEKEQHEEAIDECQKLIRLALKGLRYYQTYDRTFLGACITLGFVGWIGYILQIVVAEYLPEMVTLGHGRPLLNRKPWHWQVYLPFALVAGVITFLLYAQSLPWTNYLYCLVPVILWMKTVQGWDLIQAAVQWAHHQDILLPVLFSIVITLLGLEITVMCFFFRELVSFGLVVMGLWAYYTPLWNSDREICYCWMGSCAAVAIFPLLPVVGSNSSMPLVILAGILTIAVGIAIWNRLSEEGTPTTLDTMNRMVLSVQLAMVAQATLIVGITAYRISVKSAPTFPSQCLSWFIFCVSPLIPFFTTVDLDVRLFSLGLAFMVQYILLSITYEGLFLLLLMCLLYFWYRMEASLASYAFEKGKHIITFRDDIRCTVLSDEMSQIRFSSISQRTLPGRRGAMLASRSLELADLRRTLFFIFLIVTGFFGTGNIASINSFDPASVYCFLTVFNPFVMGSLLMMKVVLPFMVVTVMLRTVQVVTRAPLHAIILLVSIMSSFMGLNFFFLVRDYGSWLEIGTSISHYVITMSITVFVSILIGLSQLFTAGGFRSDPTMKSD